MACSPVMEEKADGVVLVVASVVEEDLHPITFSVLAHVMKIHFKYSFPSDGGLDAHVMKNTF